MMVIRGTIRHSRTIVLGLGANVDGRLGSPMQTLQWALARLTEEGVIVRRVSPLYRCEPFGTQHQPPFFNLVAVGEASSHAANLLRLIRRIENEAGRRRGRAWGPRALDIDILAMQGLPRRPAGMGRRGRGRIMHVWQKRGLVLPHPGIPERAFVLLPLCDVVPAWPFSFWQARAGHLCARLHGRVRRQCRRLASRFPSMRDDERHS